MEKFCKIRGDILLFSNNRDPVLLRAIIEAHFDARSWTERVNCDANSTSIRCAHFRWTCSHFYIRTCTRVQAGTTVTRAAANATGATTVFHLVSQLSCSHESGSIGLFFRVFRGRSYLRSCHTRTMKCRVTSRVPTMMRIALVVGVTVVHASPAEPLPSSLLGNVANTATNFRKLISRRQSHDIA